MRKLFLVILSLIIIQLALCDKLHIADGVSDPQTTIQVISLKTAMRMISKDGTKIEKERPPVTPIILNQETEKAYMMTISGKPSSTQEPIIGKPDGHDSNHVNHGEQTQISVHPGFRDAEQNAFKEHLHKKNKLRAQDSIVQGVYYLQYYHALRNCDEVIMSNEHLVTADYGSGKTKIFIKRHVQAQVSLYQTLQDVASGKWVRATKNGNTLVKNQNDATWFQVLGVGSLYVIQYCDPFDMTNSNQFGVYNGPVGTQLKITTSQTQFFKLTPA